MNLKVGFTVGQLKAALEHYAVPDDAVVFIEHDDYVRAANGLALVETREFPVFAIQARKEDEMGPMKDLTVN